MSWYALASYSANGDSRIALVLGTPDAPSVYDLESACAAAGIDTASDLPGRNLGALLEHWHDGSLQVEAVAAAVEDPMAGNKLNEIPGRVDALVAPIRPPRIFAAASNYVEHAREMGTELAKKADSNPYMFIKASTAVVGPGDNVVIPAQTRKADWEVELGAVIGQRTRRISVEDALKSVVGYTIVNDVSARDLTRRSDFPFKFDWFQGKSFDTFAPLGPWIVPASAIPDPQSLRLGLSVNNQVMQDGSSAEMIFSVSEQISYLSHMLTLEPGDVIATGTPTGVGASRGVFLQPGDVMRATIEKIGALNNPVVAENE